MSCQSHYIQPSLANLSLPREMDELLLQNLWAYTVLENEGCKVECPVFSKVKLSLYLTKYHAMKMWW
jgi:hypothetical protein